MREIDLETWPRRKHFELFRSFDNPHGGLVANVDITALYQYRQDHNFSFTVAMMYMIARAANAIPEFRYRIRENTVVEHEVIHPSTTILTDDDLFTFCHVNYSDDFSVFAEKTRKQIAYVKANPTLEDEPGKDDVLYMTAVPWVSFTSVLHPLMYPVDSIPRIAWGKFFKDGDGWKMPLGVQGHHALMDGVHMGRFYTVVQDYLDKPDLIFQC